MYNFKNAWYSTKSPETLSPCFCQDGSSAAASGHYAKSPRYAENFIVRKCHLNLYYSACRRPFISKAFLCYYRNSKKESFISKVLLSILWPKKSPPPKSPNLNYKKHIQQKITSNWKWPSHDNFFHVLF